MDNAGGSLIFFRPHFVKGILSFALLADIRSSSIKLSVSHFSIY